MRFVFFQAPQTVILENWPNIKYIQIKIQHFQDNCGSMMKAQRSYGTELAIGNMKIMTIIRSWLRAVQESKSI